MRTCVHRQFARGVYRLARARARAHTRACTHGRTHANMHVHLHTAASCQRYAYIMRMHVCSRYACMHACTCVCVCVCVCARAYVQIHTHICACANSHTDNTHADRQTDRQTHTPSNTPVDFALPPAAVVFFKHLACVICMHVCASLSTWCA